MDLASRLIGELPLPLRSEVRNALERSNRGLRGARDYVRENPREALGLAVGLGVFALMVAGTGPGRRVAKWGVSLALPYAVKWVADRVDANDSGHSASSEVEV